MITIVRLCAILLTLLCAACSKPAKLELFAKIDGGDVTVRIQRVEQTKPAMTDGVALYGSVRVTSLVPIESANLGCLYLLMGTQRSSKLYIDSVASILTDRYPANEQGVVDARVYWLFPGRQLSDIRLATIKLIADPANGTCLRFRKRNGRN